MNAQLVIRSNMLSFQLTGKPAGAVTTTQYDPWQVGANNYSIQCSCLSIESKVNTKFCAQYMLHKLAHIHAVFSKGGYVNVWSKFCHNMFG